MKNPTNCSNFSTLQIAHLSERAGLGALGHLIGVVPEADKVILIGKSDHALGVLFGHREEVLQNVAETLPQSRRKVVEDQVRVRLAHRPHLLLCPQVVPQDLQKPENVRV